MTNLPIDFSMEYSPTGVHIYGSALATSATEDYQAPQWKRLNLPGLPKNVVCSEVRITHLNSGWSQDADLIAPSIGTAYLPYGRHMLLPPKVTETTLAAAISNGCLFHCSFGTGKTLIMGGGNTANKIFFKETSETDPTPVSLTYSAAGTERVVSISPIVIASGTSAAECWVAGKDADVAAEVFSNVDTTPGSRGAMHANTANLWANFRSNINASTPGLGTNLLYADGEIYTLADNAAVNAAPTQVLSGIPSGGSGLGVEQLQKNWPVRAYMWWPMASPSSTRSALALSEPGQVVSINLEGTDPLPIPTTLNRVYYAALWNRTVVMTDSVRIVAYDGETERDLHFLAERESNSDRRWGCSGFVISGGELYAIVARTNISGVSSSANSAITLERYLPEFDAWVPVSGDLGYFNASAAGNTQVIYGRPNLLHNQAMSHPVSKQTGFLHLNLFNATVWARTWISPEGVNPFYHYNQTGADAEIAQVWNSSATVTTNKFPIPGVSKWPSLTNPPRTAQTVVYEIDASEMNLAAGGTDCTVKIEVANQSGTTHNFTNCIAATFKGSDPIDQLIKRFYGNTSSFTKGRLKWTLTQGATTTKTMNALPLTVRFMTFLDGQVVAPSVHLSKVKA